MPADADAYTLDRERIQDLPREGWAVASADRERLGAERPVGSSDKARNLHMRFRLVQKASTLDDLELLYVEIFSEFCASWHVWKPTTAKRIKIDAHCQLGNCCALKVLFNDVYIYITLLLVGNPKWGTTKLLRLSCSIFIRTAALHVGLLHL